MRSLQIENESLSDMLDRVDDRVELVRDLMEQISVEDLSSLWNQLDISAIYHDCALEGEVISPDELHAAFDPRTHADAASQPLYASLREHKRAFDMVRQIARQTEITYTLEMFKDFHQVFAGGDFNSSEDGFRKDIPLHRTYFHEISQAGQIDCHMRELVAWMNDGSDRQNLHPLAWASRFHFRFMRIFPYLETSGKVGRAMMNATLLREGYLPAVVHATERQRYYEAIRTAQGDLVVLLAESEMAALDSAIRYLRRSTSSMP